MCFDLDSRPPIDPIAGGALDAGDVILKGADGAEFRAFGARPATPTGAGILILPDVRGLHPFFEELAQRFAGGAEGRSEGRKAAGRLRGS